MKKTLLILTLLLLFILTLSYTILFTSLGNSILRPYVQARINEHSPLPLTLKTFDLDINALHIYLELEEKNNLLVSGNYSLFTQTLDLDYLLNLSDLSRISTHSKRPLAGRIHTSGKITGTFDHFTLKGESDLAQGKSDYALVFQDFSLLKAALKSEHARIETLLKMLGEPLYAHGNIDLHLQLNDPDPAHQKGSIALDISKARLNAKVLKKELGVTLDNTSLEGKLRAKLEGTELEYLTRLNSELLKLDSKGKVKTEEMDIQSHYTLSIRELALLKSLTNAPLRGPFSTHGEILGNKRQMQIKGQSDLVGSDTSYRLVLEEYTPSSLMLNIHQASLSKLLYMLGKQAFAKAVLDATIDLKRLDPKDLDGRATMTLSKGIIDQDLMNKAFGLTLPKSNFELRTKAKLLKERIDYSLGLISNLAKIDSKGSVSPEDLTTDIDYRAQILELGLLQPLTGIALRGSLETTGSIKGDKERMQLMGSSDLADSQTSYQLDLINLKPEKARLNIKKAQLSKLLHLLNQPSYAQGQTDLRLELDTLAPMNGNITLETNEGKAHSQVIKKHLDLNIPYTSFDLHSRMHINNNILHAKSRLNSNLATLDMKQSRFDINASSFKSDYTLFIPFLQRLEPLLERKLVGEFKAEGEILQDKQLKITAHSKLFDGTIDATLLDTTLDARFKQLRSLKVLKMLDYPQVMDAPLNGSLKYNTATQQGLLEARFDKATLVRSKMTDLIKALGHTDLTKEHFNHGSLSSKLNKEIIDSRISMQSKDLSIDSKKCIINSKKQLIDARFALKHRKYPADVLVKGDINAPSVKLDAKSMITPEIEQKAKKEINRFLKKLF